MCQKAGITVADLLHLARLDCASGCRERSGGEGEHKESKECADRIVCEQDQVKTFRAIVSKIRF